MLRTITKALRNRSDSTTDGTETERLLHEIWLARTERDQAQSQLQVLRTRLAQAEGAEPENASAARGLLVEPMTPLPTDPDDPRLEGWYHTIELAPGIVTKNAVYDHRPSVDLVGLPESLVGKTALDVGTANGFWAFEMERRGAERVVAADIVEIGESDILPIRSAHFPEDWATHINHVTKPFATAHAMRNSRVEFRDCNIYKLSPATVGVFDVVYCGALLVHLFNPLQALVKIRSVTREMAVIETVALQGDDYEELERRFPDTPLMRFANADGEGAELGKHCMYWYFSQKALCDMLRYAGFSRVEPRGRFRTAGSGGGNLMVTSAIGYV